MSVEPGALTKAQKISRSLKARSAALEQRLRDLERENMRREMTRVYPATVFGVPSVGDLLREIAQEHEVTLAQMMSQSRARALVLARQKAMYELYQRGMSSLQIAKALGKVCHTTILHGISAHKERLRARGEK